jgi:hypothetical protein
MVFMPMDPAMALRSETHRSIVSDNPSAAAVNSLYIEVVFSAIRTFIAQRSRTLSPTQQAPCWISHCAF